MNIPLYIATLYSKYARMLTFDNFCQNSDRIYGKYTRVMTFENLSLSLSLSHTHTNTHMPVRAASYSHAYKQGDLVQLDSRVAGSSALKCLGSPADLRHGVVIGTGTKKQKINQNEIKYKIILSKVAVSSA